MKKILSILVVSSILVLVSLQIVVPAFVSAQNVPDPNSLNQTVPAGVINMPDTTAIQQQAAQQAQQQVQQQNQADQQQAQQTFSSAPSKLLDSSSTLSDVINNVLKILNSLVPLLIGGAIVVFLYGVLVFISKAGMGNAESHKEGINFMILGIIGIAVMVSVWGLVAFVNNSLGTSGFVPQFNTSNH